ncbi:MAG: hypothetical protein ACK4UX_04845 [Thiobacillus sp.]
MARADRYDVRQRELSRVSNVLPELGEEQVAEIGMEDLTADRLDHQYRFQTFFEQTAALLERTRRR